MTADEVWEMAFDTLLRKPVQPKVCPDAGEWVPIDGAIPYSGGGTDTLEFDQIKARMSRVQFEQKQTARRDEIRRAAISEIVKG